MNFTKQTAAKEETATEAESTPAIVNAPDLSSGINLNDEATAEEEAAKTNHYSSLPIQNYIIGRFTFNKGWLSLNDDDAIEFETLVKSQPPVERNRITKYANRPTEPQAIAMTQGIDHSGNAPAAPSATQEA